MARRIPGGKRPEGEGFGFVLSDKLNPAARNSSTRLEERLDGPRLEEISLNKYVDICTEIIRNCREIAQAQAVLGMTQEFYDTNLPKFISAQEQKRELLKTNYKGADKPQGLINEASARLTKAEELMAIAKRRFGKETT